MKANKQGTVSGRRPKVKKDALSGWGQEDEFLLQEEIGIDTWYEDRIQSGRERGYVCALVESYERQEKARLYKSRNSSSRRSQRHSATTSNSSSANHKKTTKQKEMIEHNIQNKTSLLGNADTQGSGLSPTIDGRVVHEDNDPIGELIDRVVSSQSDHDNKDIAQSGDWAKEPDFQENEDDSGAGGDYNKAESPSENLAMVNLTRYEEKLRKRRENRLRKTMESIKKTEIIDTVSPSKKAANITSVTFAEGMMQPINDTENNSKGATNQNVSKTKLPSIFKAVKQNAQNCESHSKTSAKSGSDSSFKTSVENKNSHHKSSTKFNFDILEKYASIRNSKSKASFTQYVEKMRSLRHCGTEDDGLGLHCKSQDNILEEAISKEGSQSLRKALEDSLMFEHVRELWYESQRDKIVKRVNRRTRSLPSCSNGANKMMMVVDVKKRNRCMSQPVYGGDKETMNYSSLKGNHHRSKHRCPLQRMLSATNRRLEANNIASRKEQPIIRNAAKETIELTRAKNGIKCCVLGRSTPTNNQTASK